MAEYTRRLTELVPSWQSSLSTAAAAGPSSSSSRQAGGAMGPVFSTLIHTEEDLEEPAKLNQATAAAAAGPEQRGAGDQQGVNVEHSTAAAAAGTGMKLHALAGQGAVEELKELLAAGLPVDARDTEECTPLHFAADRGQVEVAQLLIEFGADIAAVDVDGQTALHYAALCGQEEVREGWQGGMTDHRSLHSVITICLE